MRFHRADAIRWGFVAALAVAGWGCASNKLPGMPVQNERPQVELTARPQPGDSVYFKVRLQWTASDPDGRVDYYIYAVDPPVAGDTVWTRIDRNETTIFFKSSSPNPALVQYPFPPAAVTSKDFHEFTIKAVDNEGMFSPPTSVNFTSRTVAPVTQIVSPVNGEGVVRTTPPSVRFEWRGTDPDREGEGQPGPPRLYKFKLISQSAIQQALSLGSQNVGPREVQEFFSRSAPDFADWDSLSADTSFKQFEGVTAGQIWFFAVVSFDIAGAYEPRFNLNNNVIKFKPSTELSPPSIVVFNSFIIRSQGSRGSFDLSEARVVKIEVPEGEPIPLGWDATVAAGTVLNGFRWVLDPIDGDIFNETQRENESQTYRWSSWSTTEQSTTLGPFYQITTVNGHPDTTIFHRFYLEARDNTGATSIMTIQFEVVRALFKDPNLAKNILFFDDYREQTDRPDHQPYANFPIESALDTLMYAVGGKLYQFRPEGTLSDPGIFAGYFNDAAGKVVSDTIDYRFFPAAGLPLSIMTQYKAVVWYTSQQDAGRTGSKFGSSPFSGLRFINEPGQLNTLAVYLSQGGKTFLFGSGVAQTIAAGYMGRFNGPGSPPATWPYQSGGNGPDRTHILWPGNFLFDYMKVKSQVDLTDFGGAGDQLSPNDNYIDFIPYLPQFQCPGAPWPPEGWTGTRDATCDPRVGPSSIDNVPVWDGLPILTMQTEFNYWPTRPPSSIACPYVSLPNFLPSNEGDLDTLYLGRCIQYRLRAARDWPDGKPVWFHVTSAQGWELDWTTVPIWYLDRMLVRATVDKIFAKWGFQRNPNPALQTGPGSVTVSPGEMAEGSGE